MGNIDVVQISACIRLVVIQLRFIFVQNDPISVRLQQICKLMDVINDETNSKTMTFLHCSLLPISDWMIKDVRCG